MLDVHPSGFYAWLQQPHSQRHQADLRLTGQIKQFWLESGCVYGYRKIHLDLRDSGQQCGVNRVWRLMKRVGIKAQVGYRSPRARKGEASIVSPNRLQRQFNPDAPDERWVTDITYIRTHEGWLYLAVVVDLFSRKIIGWSMQSRMTKDIVLNALLMAVWRRNPEKQVLVHSDQGSQYTSHEWQSFLKSHGLEGSMMDWPLYFQTLFIALPITGSPPQIFPWRTISQCTVRMPFVVMFEGLRKVLCRC